MENNEENSSSNNNQDIHKDAVKKAVESYARKRKLGEKLPTYVNTKGQSPSGPAIVTIKQNENTAFVLITNEVEEITAHVVDGVAGESGRYIRCNGHDCVMCRAKRKEVVLLLMPVFDLRQQSLVVIRGTSNEDVNSLFNQIGRIVANERPDDPPFFLNIQKSDPYNFRVVPQTVDPKLLESESLKIAREAVKDPNFSMAHLIESKSNEELLASFPMLNTELKLFGSGSNL